MKTQVVDVDIFVQGLFPLFFASIYSNILPVIFVIRSVQNCFKIQGLKSHGEKPASHGNRQLPLGETKPFKCPSAPSKAPRCWVVLCFAGQWPCGCLHWFNESPGHGYSNDSSFCNEWWALPELDKHLLPALTGYITVLVAITLC